MSARGLEFEAGQPIPGGAGGAEQAADAIGFDLKTFRGAFAELVGQDALLQRFETVAKGSAARGRAFPHTLLTGPAGTGKTTLAHALAAGFGQRLVKAAGPLVHDVYLLVRLLADFFPIGMIAIL